MIVRGGHPWLVSAGLHLVLGALVLVLVSLKVTSHPPALRMHLVGGPAAALPARGGQIAEVPLTRASPSLPAEPTLPEWRPMDSGSTPATPVTVPVALEELLGAEVPSPQETPPQHPTSGWGWSNASGEGYAPPPLPPPSLTPPQGARWTLIISVPPGGGGATAIDGLDSGHPSLDRWLENYLRTVSFPSSPDGGAYQTRWHLLLEAGKPQ